MKRIKISNKCLVALMLALPAFTQAALMVDFNSTTQVTNTSMGASGGGFGLNTVTPQLASGTSGYAGQSIYGAFSENTGAASAYNIHKTSGGARIRWGSNKGAPGDNSTALYLFKKDEFLGGLSAGTVSMDAANDTISSKFSAVNDSIGATNKLSALDMRFVIQDDTGWHISEATAYASGSAFTLEATTLNYFDYDPTTDITSIGAGEAASFNDIQFAGFYIDATRGSTLDGVNAGLQEFSVEAIPEPATLGLISAFGAGMLFIRRRFLI